MSPEDVDARFERVRPYLHPLDVLAPLDGRIYHLLLDLSAQRNARHLRGSDWEDAGTASRITLDVVASWVEGRAMTATSDDAREALLAVAAGLRCGSEPPCDGCSACATVTAPTRPAEPPVRRGIW